MKLTGEIVEITFLDHSMGNSDETIMEFKVWGLVRRVTKTAITIWQWQLQNGESDVRKDNDETAKILISTIKRIQILGPIPETHPDVQ